ncbi:MAG: M23 family metallopeptidase [Candidatus Sulfotelmatobacter sp.]
MTSRAMWFPVLFLLLCANATFGQLPAAPRVTVLSAPEHPIVEMRECNQSLNFDMVVQNASSLTLRVSEIELSVYDPAHQLVLRKSINTDAFAPSIAVIGKQRLSPGETLDVFNPFSEFESSVPLTRLKYSFCLLRESNEQQRERNQHRLPDDCDLREQLTVIPRTYKDKTRLILPLHGKIFVWEGHDLYAHHLRVPLGDPKVQALGITANSNEFASDFIYVDVQGREYHDDPRRLDNWYGYGQPIYAPGSGVVLAIANDIPENWFEDAKATKIGHPKLPADKDPKDIGNFVLIDHRNGEYSLLVHMKTGSVIVKSGERVQMGQPVGRIGFAGDSIFPHLHYSLMDGPEVFKAWGLPAYFSQFHRVLGASSISVKLGPADSGDFLESDAMYSDGK